MTGPAVDIYKQTIHGHSLDEMLKLAKRGARATLELRLRDIWADFAALSRKDSVPPSCSASSPTLPEIRHTDKIEVKRIEDGFAETSETKWQDLKRELYQAGTDEGDVRKIARTLASGQAHTHMAGGTEYEYRKVMP